MPPSRPPSLPVIPAKSARRLLLAGQGLLADPARRTTPAAVYKQIERMGFVQVDTINIVQRAHHHILLSRFDDYQPRMLTKLLERDRKLFEGWTHDASVIPTVWLDYWLLRFKRFRETWQSHPWWRQRMGDEVDQVLAHVLDRIRRNGPLMSKDFQHDRREGDGAWWGWKPQKAALEVLWRMGELAVAGRNNFHKIYDLTERVHPRLVESVCPTEEEHIDWACRTALDRLGVATPGELAGFLGAIRPAEAAGWCKHAIRDGEAIEVMVESADDSKPSKALARPDWRKRLGRCPVPPERMRLLSPFDPVIRDRKRALRLFGFDYRFEAFVPAAKREYGYYVTPILEDDRLVGRLDPKLHRDQGLLSIRGLWWEPNIRVTKKRRLALDEAIGQFTSGIGGERFVFDQ